MPAPPLRVRSTGGVLAGLLLAATLTGGALSWLASDAPEGLEWSVARAARAVPAAEGRLHAVLASAQARLAATPGCAPRGAPLLVTLLLHLCDALVPREGRVRVGGVPVTRTTLETLRRAVGAVLQGPEDRRFPPTVRDDVAFGPQSLGLPPRDVEARVSGALGAVDAFPLAPRAVAPFGGPGAARRHRDGPRDGAGLPRPRRLRKDDRFRPRKSRRRRPDPGAPLERRALRALPAGAPPLSPPAGPLQRAKASYAAFAALAIARSRSGYGLVEPLRRTATASVPFPPGSSTRPMSFAPRPIVPVLS